MNYIILFLSYLFSTSSLTPIRALGSVCRSTLVGGCAVSNPLDLRRSTEGMKNSFLGRHIFSAIMIYVYIFNSRLFSIIRVVYLFESNQDILLANSRNISLEETHEPILYILKLC